MQYIINRLIK